MIKIHNVFEKWPVGDKSIQSIITSPPYWSLRKYDIPDVMIGKQDCVHKWGSEIIKGEGYTNVGKRWNHGKKRSDTPEAWNQKVSGGNFCIHCNAWKGQHGLEPTYQQYIEHTRLWAKEAWRVLRDDGVFFLNLGDSYSGMKVGNTQGCYGNGVVDKSKSYANTDEFVKQKQSLPSKCKILIPHRVAIALIDDGWILRNDIIWFKPNAMPESCRDRFSKKFEYIFMFTKQQRYYFDLDGVREKHRDPRDIERRIKKTCTYKQKWLDTDETKRGYMEKSSEGNKVWEIGKNPGDCWTINTQPSPFKHYAIWPEKLVERMILCSTKKEDMVLDPFAGSASTLYMAEKLNRKGMGFDLGYQDIQKIRLSEIQKDLL